MVDAGLDAELDAMVGKGTIIHAVFVPAAWFVREQLSPLAEEAGFAGDGSEAFALVHACQFRSGLVADMRQWGEFERFRTLREAVAWCRACKLRWLVAEQNASAAVMILQTLVLVRHLCASAAGAVSRGGQASRAVPGNRVDQLMRGEDLQH